MKKEIFKHIGLWLLMTCLVIGGNSFAQTIKQRKDVCLNCVEYDYPEFKVIKDAVTYQTVIESYTVQGSEVAKGIKQFDRSKISFHADPGQTDMTDDYYKSGYAIGHVKSAKDCAFSLSTLTHSMLWLNTNLQQQSMNAGPWLGLENHERDEAIRLGVINIKVGVYGNIGYTKSADNKHSKSHHAVIPAMWWKALIYKDSTVVWVMPNKVMPQHTADYPKFKRTLQFLIDSAKVDLAVLN